MDPVRNPFAPGAGTPPPELAGRQDILDRARVTLARLAQGRSAKSFLLVGLRGVGKTVLLNEIKTISHSLAYKHIMIEAHENKELPDLLVPHLRQALLQLDLVANIKDHAKRSLQVLKSFANSVKVKFGEVEFALDTSSGTADSGDLEVDLPDLLMSVAGAAQAGGTPIAIIIDEMQYLSEVELSALIMAVHKVVQNKLPLVVVGAGLPQLVGLTGRSKSYAERLFDFPPVGPLSGVDARNALQGPVEREGVKFTEPALNAIISITEGYPYFLQEWGFHAWNKAAAAPISVEAVRDSYASAINSLDESFFRVRFDRLTPREKDYLRAMAELGAGPHRSGDIAAIEGVKVETVAPLRNGLVKKGMIYSPAHGDTAFTVPLFDQYMKRIIPTLRKPRGHG
jgi:hypothetical protein